MNKPIDKHRAANKTLSEHLRENLSRMNLPAREKQAILELTFSEKVQQREIKRVLSAISWLHEIFADGEPVLIDSVQFSDTDKN